MWAVKVQCLFPIIQCCVHFTIWHIINQLLNRNKCILTIEYEYFTTIHSIAIVMNLILKFCLSPNNLLTHIYESNIGTALIPSPVHTSGYRLYCCHSVVRQKLPTLKNAFKAGFKQIGCWRIYDFVWQSVSKNHTCLRE